MYPRIHGGGEAVKKIVTSAEYDVFDVQERDHDGEQSRQRDRAEQRSVEVVWRQGQRAFAQMGQALRESDHEEIVGVFLMVLRQLSQHGCQSGVVRPRANDAHGEDGVVSNLRITVVRELGESVEDVEFGV